MMAVARMRATAHRSIQRYARWPRQPREVGCRCGAFCSTGPRAPNWGARPAAPASVAHHAVTATVSTQGMCAASRTAHINGMTETSIDDRWASLAIRWC